jgi:hypothetical protein
MLVSLPAVVALAVVCLGAMLPVEESMAKKPNNFHSKVEHVVRFLEDDDRGDENGDDSVSVSMY